MNFNNYTSYNNRIIVRKIGKGKLEFYRIIKRRTQRLFLIQKIKMEIVCGDPKRYCYVIPFEFLESEIIEFRLVARGFRFEHFCHENQYGELEVLYFQHDENQNFWDGFPQSINLMGGKLTVDDQKEIDDVNKKHQEYLRSLVRAQLLGKVKAVLN